MPGQLHYCFEYGDDSWRAEGYVARPDDLTGPSPCVLVAHDWSGINQYIRSITERFAELGYVTVAIDAYGKGKRGDVQGDNSHLMNPLMENRDVLRERLLRGFEAARAMGPVDASRIGVVGYCFGGLCALDLARVSPPGLRCAVSFHGGLTQPTHAIASPVEPKLLILHGWEDPMAPPGELKAALDSFSSAGANWETHIYSHTLHAFTFKEANSPERGIVYNPRADRRSWDAATTFLHECLIPGGDAEPGEQQGPQPKPSSSRGS
jgi:dienelactone hydrolase